MGNEKVECQNCQCWAPIGDSGRGDCKRNPPATFEQVLACWPQTMYDNYCFDGIKKEPTVLNEDK